MPRSTKARKCTETTTGDSKHPDEPSNCIICLEKVVCRGKLSVCNHWFCFPCILEWSENTNTCPICKTRFRCVTKIHLDPFRSPPTKVRVGDRDQRVWNDDDDLVADDVPDSDNSNGDQEPSFSSENSQTRSTTRQVDRRGTSGTSRQLRLDDYDYEDSFIDDTDEALQAYLYSTYSQEALHVDVIDNGTSEESSSGESSNDSVGQRTSPYKLRNSNRHNPVTTSSRNTRSSTFDSLPNTGVDELCLSPASANSLLIVSDDDDVESSDEMNIVVPTANHSKESKGKRKVTTRKHHSRTRKSSETSRPNSSTSRRSQRSHKPRKQQGPQERCSKSNSKRKRQISASEDEFQPGTSSRNRSQTSQPSIEGWISMATKRARADSSTSSTANQRTVSRNRACKGKKPVENGESSHHIEPYESSSDSENEVLIDRIKKARVKARSDGKKCQNASKTSVTTRENENKQSNKFCARQELHQQGINSPSPSTSTEIQEDDFSIITFIKPTPQPDKKRSIFTRRQHRPPSTSFDHLEDFAVSDTEMQQNQSGLTNHHIKTISNHKKAETALVCKSGIVIKLEKSPFIKKKKQQRRRVVSLSSDSD